MKLPERAVAYTDSFSPVMVFMWVYGRVQLDQGCGQGSAAIATIKLNNHPQKYTLLPTPPFITNSNVTKGTVQIHLCGTLYMLNRLFLLRCLEGWSMLMTWVLIDCPVDFFKTFFYVTKTMNWKSIQNALQPYTRKKDV